MIKVKMIQMGRICFTLRFKNKFKTFRMQSIFFNHLIKGK